MTEPPRCPKCGSVPPIRKVEGTMARGSVTYQCCGEVYEIDVASLEPDTKLVVSRPEAA